MVSTPCGIELIGHHISLLLERNLEWVVLKADVKNAFNSLSREHMLHQTNSVFPSVAKHVFQMYHDVSALIAMQEGCSVLLQSEVGVHQGDPLGPALFALTIHPYLVNLQNIYPKIQVLAYLNDVFLVGAPADVINALNSLSVCFQELGLNIHHDKCDLYCPDLNISIPDCPVPVKFDGIAILGLPIGTADFVSSYCSLFADSRNRLRDQLVALNDAQSASLLLRYFHVPRLNHLAGTVCPSLLFRAS